MMMHGQNRIKFTCLRIDPFTHSVSFKKIYHFFHTFVQGPYFILFIYNNCWVSGDPVLQNLELTVHIIGISSPHKLFQFQSYTDI